MSNYLFILTCDSSSFQFMFPINEGGSGSRPSLHWQFSCMFTPSSNCEGKTIYSSTIYEISSHVLKILLFFPLLFFSPSFSSISFIFLMNGNNSVGFFLTLSYSHRFDLFFFLRLSLSLFLFPRILQR